MPSSFLLIGIAWDQYEAMFGAEKAPEMIMRFKDVGLEYQYLDYAPGESMQRLEKVLQEKKFSGGCVGIGIRADAQFTTMFEALVNFVHEKSPKSKLLFNTSPDGTLEAAKRWFPEAGNAKK
ncbi:hypothetical protein V8E51_010620 [Hyaloscypha variabilis]